MCSSDLKKGTEFVDVETTIPCKMIFRFQQLINRLLTSGKNESILIICMRYCGLSVGGRLLTNLALNKSSDVLDNLVDKIYNKLNDQN